MKTRLLKKIRKRFDWYLRKGDKVPVILDLKLNRHIIFTDDTLIRLGKYENQEALEKATECGLEIFRWRMAKDYMYKKFGYSIVDALFREAKRYGVNYKTRKP